MKFKLWLEQIEITEPYYRIVIPAMYGGRATEKLGSDIAPTTYWTPRWDAILFMLRSARFHYSSSSYKEKDAWSVKIYKLDKAIMDDAPKNHKWAFQYGHDAGEMILVKALSEPKIIINTTIDSHEVDNLIDDSFNYTAPINYSNGAKAINKITNQTLFIMPNYKTKSLEVAEKSGWKFNVIKNIKSIKELDDFSKLYTVDDDELAISWFIHDVNW